MILGFLGLCEPRRMMVVGGCCPAKRMCNSFTANQILPLRLTHHDRTTIKIHHSAPPPTPRAPTLLLGDRTNHGTGNSDQFSSRGRPSGARRPPLWAHEGVPRRREQ